MNSIKILALLLFLSTPLTVKSVPIDTLSTGPARKKVGLVLSGGGAKGIAHVGVLKVLEEAGIPIDYIAGTSMGAIVGGLYSIGYSPEVLDSMFRRQDWTSILTNQISRDKLLFTEKEINDKAVLTLPFNKKRVELPTGVLSGEAIFNMLTFYTTGYHEPMSFDSLPIPFACVAYDLETGDEIVMREGNLATAIRASMSIPGAFATVQIDEHILVDGGVINNYPVDVVKMMGADLVIGVDVSMITETRESEEEEVLQDDIYGSVTYIYQKIVDRIGKEKFLENYAMTDLYLHPDVNPYLTTSFNPQAIDSLLLRGERIARQKIDSLYLFKESVFNGADESYLLPGKRNLGINYPLSDSIMIGNISFNGIGLLNEPNLRQMFRFKDNTVIDPQQIIDGLERMKGTGLFSTVSYRLTDGGLGTDNLVVDCIEKSLNSINLGFRLDSRQISSGYINATWAPQDLSGAIVGVSGRLSSSPYANIGLYYQNAWIGRFGMSYQFRKSNLVLHNGIDSIGRNALFIKNVLNLDIANFYYRNFNFYLSLLYEHFVPRSSEFFRTDATFGSMNSEDLLIYRGGVSYDNFDHAYYPRKGVRFNADYSLFTDDFVRYKEGKAFMAVGMSFAGAIPASARLTIVPSVYGRYINNDDAPFLHRNFIGGIIPGYYTDEQMPFYGLNTVALIDNRVFALSLEMRYRLGNNHYIWVKGNAAGSSKYILETFNPNRASYLFGGAVGYSFSSPFGPLDVMIDFSNYAGSRSGLYINLGKHF